MTLLVGTNDGLFALDASGAPRRLAPGRVRAFAPDGPSDVWAVFDDGALRHGSADGTWSPARYPVDDITTVLHRPDGVLVGTAEAQIWRVDGDTAARLAGFDHVDGRDAWHAVGSADPYVRSLTATADGAAVLASVHVGGIPRSTDGGLTWRPTLEVDDDVHEVRAHPVDPSIVAAAAAVGLVESHDGGASWARAPRSGLHASYLRAVAFVHDGIVVGASDGPFGQHAALYRRPLGGGAFERCSGGLPEWMPVLVDTGALAASGSLVAAGAGDTVFVSEDDAHTWRVLASGLPHLRAVTIRDDSL